MTTTTTPSTEPREWDRSLTSRAERYAAGKALRSKAPRSSHASWAPDPERPDPISILEESNSTRIPQLVPIRYGRMAMSPFAFFRGSADVMASDLARTPVSGIQAQICGDAHLSNFGVYASPERRQVFDVNDFDETLAGPWEWDVKRLAASKEGRVQMPSRKLCNGTKQKSRKTRFGLGLAPSHFTSLHNIRYGIRVQAQTSV